MLFNGLVNIVKISRIDYSRDNPIRVSCFSDFPAIKSQQLLPCRNFVLLLPKSDKSISIHVHGIYAGKRIQADGICVGNNIILKETAPRKVPLKEQKIVSRG